MMTQSRERQAVAKALESSLTFAYFIFPNDTEEYFFATDRGISILEDSSFDKFDGFVFSKFGLDHTIKAFGIKPDLTVEDVLNHNYKETHLLDTSPAIQNSTDKKDYLLQAERIISGLHSDEEKTVLSHLKKVESSKSFAEITAGYFQTMTDCFRYIYFTPDTGLWFGATPELLLTYDSESRELGTMSLAGTCQTEDERYNWDIKNRIEHELVTQYIVSVLNDHGLNVSTPEETNLRFGNIIHLCHHIQASGHVVLSQLISRLSPTPALLGWPREQAYQQITDNETHKRICYGGFVGYKNKNLSSLYVNLRCGMAWPSNDGHCTLNLFSGGGLTTRSDPESEWDEAESKLVKLIEQI